MPTRRERELLRGRFVPRLDFDPRLNLDASINGWVGPPDRAGHGAPLWLFASGANRVVTTVKGSASNYGS
jgi:hypothetical protein